MQRYTKSVDPAWLSSHEAAHDRLPAVGGTELTWARLDDGVDEELCDLSHEAFRLYICALTYNRRRQLGGVMTTADIAHLCRAQGIKPTAVTELLSTDRWQPEEDGTTSIRAFEKFNPLSSVERVRRFRERRRNGDVTPDVTSGNAPSHAGARAGSPRPIPRPIPNESPNGDSVARRVFVVWQEMTSHPQARLLPSRFKLIAARMRDGLDESDLTDCARGVPLDPWSDRVLHNSFEQIYRSAASVEKFRDLYRNGVPVPPLRLNRIDAEILQIGVFGDHPA